MRPGICMDVTLSPGTVLMFYSLVTPPTWQERLPLLSRQKLPRMTQWPQNKSEVFSSPPEPSIYQTHDIWTYQTHERHEITRAHLPVRVQTESELSRWLEVMMLWLIVVQSTWTPTFYIIVCCFTAYEETRRKKKTFTCKTNRKKWKGMFFYSSSYSRRNSWQHNAIH